MSTLQGFLTRRNAPNCSYRLKANVTPYPCRWASKAKPATCRGFANRGQSLQLIERLFGFVEVAPP
ncbi:hypothetical protein [Micromonospora sp. NPDC093277]|uniref:hypothetical protein n=1 Tax=Micromonospora sp. NPDC093277 TaxID=3364291 RepID=UPI003814E559